MKVSHKVQMVRILRGINLCLAFALAVSLFLTPASPSSTVLAAGVSSHAGLMPPHPRLQEKIDTGEVTLPVPLKDSSTANILGFDAAGETPRQLNGTINSLAVVVDFSDNVSTVTASYFDTLIFAAPVAGRGSVRDYYAEVSYNTVDIVTVNLPSSLGWIRAPQTYSYYTGGNYCTDAPYPNNCQKLAEDVVDAVNGVVNFANYDNNLDGAMEPIMLIHAGEGAEFTGSPSDIWSHSWVLNSPRNYDGVSIGDYVIMPEYWVTASASTSDMTIGVFVHEMGHGFWDLPDLYDRDGSSEGIGSWSLMAGGSWNGPNSGGWGSDGSSPAWPDAWTRIEMGFASATNIGTNGTYNIPQAYNNPTPATTILRIHTAQLHANEFFLLENRQQTANTYDQYLPGNGLLIWHVDEAMDNFALQNDFECTTNPDCNCSDSQHFLVQLEQADGLQQLDIGTNRGDTGDTFPGSTNNRTFSGATQPETSSWYTCSATSFSVTSIGNSGASMSVTITLPGSVTPTEYIYLPFIIRTDPPPPPPPPTNLCNGTFEAGHTCWTEFSTHGWDIIMSGPWPGTVTPHAGSWASWLGGDYDDISYIQQQITVPAATPYLGFWYWIASEDVCGYDYGYLVVNGTPFQYINLCEASSTGGWVHYAADLSPYAGQTITFKFQVETDGSLNSNMFVDDVAWQSTPATIQTEGTNFNEENVLPHDR